MKLYSPVIKDTKCDEIVVMSKVFTTKQKALNHALIFWASEEVLGTIELNAEEITNG